MANSASDRVFELEKISHTKLSSLDKERTFVLATLSPLEVHGPHLPLGQDYFEGYHIARHAALGLAERHPDWTFVLTPPFPIATDCLPKLGSVEFPVGLVKQVAFHALEPFAKHGFARLAFSSFHGGPRHVCALEAAGEELTRRYGVPAASLFSMVLARIMEGDVFFEGVKDVPGREITVAQLKQDHHAGFVETSMALHLWPDLIEDGWDDLASLVPETPDDGGQTNDSYLYGYEGKASLGDKAKRNLATVESIFRAIKHFNQHTYYGHPGLASAEQGEALFKHLTGIGVEAAEQFMERGTEMGVHSPLWRLRKLLLNPAVNRIVNSGMKIYQQ